MKQNPCKRFILIPILIGIFCLNACGQGSSKCICSSPKPIIQLDFPLAGKKVADELEKAGSLEHTWEWLGRVYRYREMNTQLPVR